MVDSSSRSDVFRGNPPLKDDKKSEEGALPEVEVSISSDEDRVFSDEGPIYRLDRKDFTRMREGYEVLHQLVPSVEPDVKELKVFLETIAAPKLASTEESQWQRGEELHLILGRIISKLLNIRRSIDDISGGLNSVCKRDTLGKYKGVQESRDLFRSASEEYVKYDGAVVMHSIVESFDSLLDAQETREELKNILSRYGSNRPVEDLENLTSPDELIDFVNYKKMLKLFEIDSNFDRAKKSAEKKGTMVSDELEKHFFEHLKKLFEQIDYRKLLDPALLRDFLKIAQGTVNNAEKCLTIIEEGSVLNVSSKLDSVQTEDQTSGVVDK